VGGALYIHETMTITIEHRKRYLEHFCSWIAIGIERYNMPCFGVWATVGSTGEVPEAICMWELPDIEALGHMLSGEFEYLVSETPEIGDHFDTYWGGAPDLAPADGFDRLLIATERTPTIAEAIGAGIRADGYYHETVTTAPGGIEDHLARYEDEFVPVGEEHGLVYVGGYRTSMRNDTEGIVLWGLPEWNAVTALERGLRSDDRARAWRKRAAEAGTTWVGKLLTPAEQSPLVTGRLIP
jgi:hypothetical protein